MFSKLKNIFGKNISQNKLKLIDFDEIRIVSDDVWNKIPNGQVTLRYFNNDKDHIATISFRLHNGQIGLLFVHDNKLKGRGLGKEMLKKAIEEIKYKNSINPGIKEIWAVTHNDLFFSNVFNQSFVKRDPAHHTVTGSGYYLDIKENIE